MIPAPDVKAVAVLVHAAMQLSSSGSLEETERERRRVEIYDLLDRLHAAVAVFIPPECEAVLTNAAWRTRLGRLPARLWERIAVLDRALDEDTLEISHDFAGVPTHYSAHFGALRDSRGTPEGVIISCVDITERVHARRFGVDEHALIWSGGFHAPADYHNAAWRAYAGAAQREWDAIVDDADVTRCHEALQQASRQRVSAPIEVRLRREDGWYRWHRVTFAILAEEARWYGIAIDVDDERSHANERSDLVSAAQAARADAELATRLKDEFIARVSHELRAPLMTMLLWERVLREPLDEATRAQALDAIRQSALAQSKIVGDLLDVSRAISGKLHIEARPIPLGDVIGGALQAAFPTALARRIQLTHDSTGAIEILGDATRLRQVLDNVLSNALKFTAPGGHVSVSTRSSGDRVEIAVRDSGRGIAAEQLEQIFEPFRQSDDMLTRQHGGLGLGLAISRELVELHGGRLTATSDGPGRGATFTIQLPTSSSRRAHRPSGEVLGMLEHRRVLVIDDDARVREALLLLLARAGVVVDTATSAAHAREYLASATPDVLICDIGMPGEDGYSFIRVARAAGCTIPAIALTAHAMETDITRALDAGFDVHLAKPVRFEQLVSTIGRLVSSEKISATS